MLNAQFTEFLNAQLGRETFPGWEKSIYKGTACGAWIELVDADTIRLGSIVEGADACAEVSTLVWPITAELFWSELKSIEDQCDEIWNETHDENGAEK